MGPSQPPPSEPTSSAPGDTITVEAATAEKALEEVTGLLGPDAEIVRADKVQRGGIGGFFAKEMVQLTARRRPGGPVTPAAGAAPAGLGTAAPVTPAAAAPAGLGTAAPAAAAPRPALPDPGAPAAPQSAGPPVVSHLVAEPVAEAPAPERDLFAEALGRFLAEETAKEAAASGPAPEAQPAPALPTLPPVPAGPSAHGPGALAAEALPDEPSEPAEAAPAASAPSAAPSAGAAPGPSPATVALDGLGTPLRPAPKPATLRAGAAAPGTGAPSWSPEVLLRLGMPAGLVRPLLETDPRTDGMWIDALARAVARFCGPLSNKPELLAGPRAHLLAEPLRLPQVDYPDAPPAGGSFILSLHVASADLGLVLRLAGDRRFHLVAGGEGWERLIALRPSVVSWAGAEALPKALGLCATHALTLGYGRAGAGAPTFRATPLDVALAVRELVGRR